MKIFVAGATGVIGRQLVPLLRDAGHDVVGTSRRPGAADIEMDVFDREAVMRAVAEAEPDVVVHQLTDLSDADLDANARIRAAGTRNLVDATLAAGVPKIIAQSIAWAYDTGRGAALECEPLRLPSINRHEDACFDVRECVVLRYGLMYGPGTWYAPGDRIEEQLRAGELTADEAISSFVHVRDAAAATVLALRWPSGPVNVVDDDPAPSYEWLPELADTFGAPSPPRRIGAEPWARGACNTLARIRGWVPEFPSWRAGFASQLSEPRRYEAA
jgi:nucleoside-diphosphate-sugar epimerase